MNHRLLNRVRYIRTNGFSLIELIGVLAVLAIVISVTTESVLSRVSYAQRRAEETELSRIATGAQRWVRENHQLPSPSDWATQAAQALASSTSMLRTNSGGGARLWVPDPRWRVAENGSEMGYRQGAYGTPRPENVRVLLLSAVNGDRVDPANIDFDSWWERGSRGVPPPEGGEGAVQDNDILVERIGFAPLFHRIILNNLSMDLPARWAVDRIEEEGVCAPGRRHEAHYVETSRLLLIDSEGAIQEVVLVEESTSWAFFEGRWHRSLGQAPGAAWTEVSRIPSDLMELPTLSGVEPREIADAMYDFMGAYLRWSADGYRIAGITPSHRRVTEAAERLVDVAGLFLQP